MTPEQITRNLYTWLMEASRIDHLPMGFHPCTWDQLRDLDPGLARKWQLGVDLFLATIGASVPQDGDEHLNFIGTILPVPEPAPESEPGEDMPPVRPDD
jgi:hypothetical protein